MNTEEILNWLAALFNEPVENLCTNTLREDIPEWDSIGVLNLIAELDSEYGIILTDQEIKSIDTVGNLIEILDNHGKVH